MRRFPGSGVIGTSDTHPRSDFCRGCDVEWYTALDDIARFCEFGAARLASLRLTSNIPNFGGVQPWLELLPHLKTLTLSCDTKDDVGVESEQSGFQARAPPGMRAPEHKPVDVAYGVEELTLSGEHFAQQTEPCKMRIGWANC